jgi:hypothetical protein
MNNKPKKKRSKIGKNEEIEIIQETSSIIKERVLDVYILNFNNFKEFMDVYDERLLKLDVIEFWINKYCLLNDIGKKVIRTTDYEDLMGTIYKEYCQIMMGKLVDIGYLAMMWDNEKKIVFWRKTEYNINHE